MLILVGCGGSASVGRDGDATGGDGVNVDVVVVDGTSSVPPPVTYAQYCQTQWGTCQMSVAMLKGQSCTCYWANGSFSYGMTF
ncbi:hypothetical protein [Vibrio crassostreae]|uniref:hypothetical protein n=1 Tax=Vibrio crassostreae TaxID=246167 RepID=UPI001B311817|nr:hypothetical protein [Vibrio crassostreae]